MSENRHTMDELKQWQALPLALKIRMSCTRIRMWVDEYGEDGCYVSFSGGKDSTVLLDLVRNECGFKNVKAMFVDVPTQYPELRDFVKTWDNVDIIQPKISFVQVCDKYGFPLISKEVSECVAGARRYLKNYMNESGLQKAEEVANNPGRYNATEHFQNVMGYRRNIKDLHKAEILDEAHIDSIIKDEKHEFYYETDKLCGTRRKETKDEIKKTISNWTYMADILGIDRRDNKDNEELQKLKNGEIPDEKYKYGVNIRLLMLNGIYPHREKGVMTDEYSNRYDKSRYKFFMDAPFEISNKCCNVMKKAPAHKYQKETGRYPITAQMAEESMLRTSQWLKNGCNGFHMKAPISNPLSFWTEQDILQYIYERKLPICSVYGDIVPDYSAMDMIEGQTSLLEESKPQILRTTGCKRTGCMLCGFGCHLEKEGEGRFELLKKTHPKMYTLLDLCKNNGITFREAIEWTNEHGNLNIRL